MEDLEKAKQDIVAALLTMAWASTKKRDVSQYEIKSVYKNFGGDA